MQGGFIWDLIDQGLVLGKRPGCFGYGGDFNDFPNTAQFCINGILGPDRVPHPIAYEAASLQSPIDLDLKIETLSPNSYRIYLVIRNRRSFVDLSDFNIFLALGTNLSPVVDIADFMISLNQLPAILPQSVFEYDITFCLEDLVSESSKRFLDTPSPVDSTQFSQVTEVWINSSVRRRTATECVPIGHQIVSKTHFHPLLLPLISSSLQSHPKVSRPISEMKMVSESSDQVLTIQWANGNQIQFGCECGRLLSWIIHGQQVLISPLEICLWRAPTDNDRGGAFLSYYEQWKAYGLDCLHPEKSSIQPLTIISEDRNLISLSTSLILVPSHPSLHTPRIRCQYHYTIHSNGEISIETTVDLPRNIPPPPRIGLRTALSSSLNQVKWFGYGPHEAYDDRKSSVTLGLFSNEIDDLHVPYVYPQECGHRYDPRWLQFHDSNSEKIGFHLLIDRTPTPVPCGSETMCWGWNTSRYSIETLESTRHNYELENDPNNQIHFHIDRVMMGLGGYDSWSPNVEKKYLIQNGKWKFKITLIPNN